MYVQFPDLTEISVASARKPLIFPAPDLYAYYNWFGAQQIQEVDFNKTVKTMFAFGVSAPTNRVTNPDGTTTSVSEEILLEQGFQHLASGMNWYPSHILERRTLKFFWKKFPENTEPVPLNRKYYGGRQDDSWPYSVNEKNFGGKLTSTGCGFSFQSFPLCPKEKRIPIKYFTLLRAPLNLSKFRETWMKSWNFRKIDEGINVSYWLNGFDPKGYTPAYEVEYWKEREAAYRTKRKIGQADVVG
jgi:hypothetical protein